MKREVGSEKWEVGERRLGQLRLGNANRTALPQRHRDTEKRLPLRPLRLCGGIALAACVALLVSVSPAVADDEITPAAEAAIWKALDWLAKQQRADGSIDESTAETSLAGLAFMVVGETPGRGKYAATTSRILQYVLNNVGETGLVLGRNQRSPMYHHGFATLYLTQTWGLTGYESIRAKLKKAVDLIVLTQSSKGGWRYFPGRDEQDISVTIVELVALRAARNCGIEVPDQTIQRAIAYVRSLANPKGGFGYQSSSDLGIARTGAGMFSLQVCGEYNDPRIQKGFDYLTKHGMFDSQWEHYGLYYISASLYQIGGEAWSKRYPVIRDRLIKSQRTEGSWGSETYKTSMAVLTLSVPYHFLPIYQR